MPILRLDVMLFEDISVTVLKTSSKSCYLLFAQFQYLLKTCYLCIHQDTNCAGVLLFPAMVPLSKFLTCPIMLDSLAKASMQLLAGISVLSSTLKTFVRFSSVRFFKSLFTISAARNDVKRSRFVFVEYFFLSLPLGTLYTIP